MVWNNRLSRRSTLVGGALAGAGALIGGSTAQAHAATNVDIVVNGVRKALVVKPSGTLDVKLVAAIDDIVYYVEESTGVILPVLTQAQLDASGATYNGNARMYIGFVGVEGDPALPAAVAGLAPDGFAIATYGNTLAIVGPTGVGTRIGACEFLERFLNIRWLMPTALGDDVPTRTTLSIPPTSIMQEPVFASRQLGGVDLGPGDHDKRVWMARNRTNSRIHFSHNLHFIFNPFKYANEEDYPDDFHEEYYPIRNGAPYLPKFTDEDTYEETGWQPRFTEQSTVDRAVAYALERFASPTVYSISLGVNDSQGFSTTDPDDPPNPNRPDGKNSQGFIGKSRVYFAWVNDVAREVAKTYPDRVIGCLAYNATADPPNFALEPNVVVYLTRDRYGWVDSTIEASEKARQIAWEAVANRIGWYDYIYGSPYAIPRLYARRLGDIYEYGAAHSTDAAYAEAYPSWGEGPKLWVYLKKLWNPALDVDALLTEWYQRAVGSSAAPYLAQFYGLFENFWALTVPSTDWFQSRVNLNYLNFRDARYLASLPATLIDDAADLMNTVVSRAPADTPYKSRANKLKQAFDYYEASARSYPRGVTTPSTSAAAIAIIDNLAPALEAYATRTTLLAQFANDALLYQYLRPQSWLYWNGSQFWALVDYLRAYEPSGGTATTRLTTESTSASHVEVQEFARLVLSVADAPASMAANYSFETASGTSGAHGWGLWVSSSGTLARSTEQHRVGTASVKATSLARGGPAQGISVSPGLLALRTFVYAAGTATQWHGTFQYSVVLRDGAGTDLSTLLSGLVPVSRLAGAWRPINALFRIPPTVGTTPVEKINLVLVLNGFQNDPAFYLDDVYVHQVP